MADSPTTEPMVAALREQLKAEQADVVDLTCQIRFMQGRLGHERKKRDVLRDLVGIMEAEKNDAR